MKAKKIWHLISNRWYSAITAYAINATKALEIHGHQCVFSPLKNSPGEKKAIAQNLKTLSFSSFKYAQLFNFLYHFKSIKPDVIIVYGGPEEFLCKFLPKKKNLMIFRFQGDAIKSRSLNFPWIFYFSHRHIDLLLSPSNRISKTFEHFKKIPKVLTLNLGIDTKLFKPHPAADPFERSKRPVILIFGRLDPIKGHIEFIKLFRQLLKMWDPAMIMHQLLPRLKIVGLPANTSKDQLEREVKLNELRLGEDVIINCNKIDDPTLLLSNASLGAIPSLGSEEICRVAQEFLLCGTPIFVSGVGALNEVLFMGAGESYKGKSSPEVVLQLKNLLEKSISETNIARDLRASLAKSFFSLHSMGSKLGEAIFTLPQ
ncbi:MAG: glycosyltransferase family 4 protein [Oligoflexales bacterium]